VGPQHGFITTQARIRKSIGRDDWKRTPGHHFVFSRCVRAHASAPRGFFNKPQPPRAPPPPLTTPRPWRATPQRASRRTTASPTCPRTTRSRPASSSTRGTSCRAGRSRVTPRGSGASPATGRRRPRTTWATARRPWDPARSGGPRRARPVIVARVGAGRAACSRYPRARQSGRCDIVVAPRLFPGSDARRP